MARTLPIRLRTIAAGIVVLSSGLIIWNAYQSIFGSSDITGATLPIIKADSTAFRIEPEDRGGAEIPNQGNQLFDVLNTDNNDDLALDGVNINHSKEPETIYEDPPSTEGFALPELPDRLTESLFEETIVENEEIKPEDDVVEPIAYDDKQILQEKLKVVIEKAEAPNAELKKNIHDLEPASGGDSLTKISVLPSQKPEYSKPVRAEAIAIARPVIQAPVAKKHYIQLASLRGEEAAREAYNTIRADYPELVEGLNVSFPQANLGTRGTFTRIQVGPLDSESEARNRCANYNAVSGATCLVLSR